MKEEASKRFKGKKSKSFNDFTGKSIGLIFVKERVENDRFGSTQYLCECKCGKSFITGISSLRRSKYKKCRCSIGHSELKRVLRKIRERCYNKNSKDYKYYGEKGISLCQEWDNFPIKFVEWSLLNGWEKGLTIDRIDTNGNYEPSNCQWISRSEHSKKTMEHRWAQKNTA